MTPQSQVYWLSRKLAWLPFPPECDSCSLQYSSSRPSSIETARLGSRTNSVSSQTRPDRDPRPLSLRYSSPQHGSYLQPAESAPLSQIYSTPYSALHRVSPQRLEKAPLVKVSRSGVELDNQIFPLRLLAHFTCHVCRN